MVLGDGYINRFRPESRSGTHADLARDHGLPPGSRDGGAIRVNPDGSIDVSGYHARTESQSAANAIRDILLSINPNLTVRTTPGRLTDLPAP